LDNFKSKALNSTFWSFFETFGNQGIQFVIGIFLARLLLPEDYGITGVLAVFIGIAGVLVDSGFKTSIIRSNDITDVDCSTIFYVNLLVSIFTGLMLFVSGAWIADFFNKPELINVTRVFALIPLINGLGVVQSALLFKNLQFKLNAKISITSNIISGGIALFLAFKGFSYWALVWRAIISSGIYTLLLWVSSSWKPKLIFSFEILKKHFKFSSRLLLTGMIDSFFDNIYSFIFGKYFSFKELGFFTRGKGFVDMVTRTLSVTIQKVNTPLLAASGKEDEYKINAYSKLLRASALLIFPATVLLVVVAEPMIIFLIGEKWLPAVSFLQILAIAGLTYPITNANSSLFEVLGHSNIILKIALTSRPIQLIILIISINFNAHIVAWGIVTHQIILLGISYYYINNLLKQKILGTLKNLIPAISISLSMGFIVYLAGLFFSSFFKPGVLFALQLASGFLISIFLLWLFRISEFNLLKKLIINILHKV
jgi:O-antigen/teichoic acid export membrane protein